MENEKVKFMDLTWDPNDLFASKNMLLVIMEDYGEEAVDMLQREGFFGSLDVAGVIEEEFGA